MKAKEKTAGKTALKTRNTNTERIERWRKHVAKRIDELANFKKPRMDSKSMVTHWSNCVCALMQKE